MNNESSCTNNYLIALIILALCTITGCSATGKAFMPIEQTQDKALIYIYRPDRFLGSGNVWYLSDDEKQITMVNNGGWFAYTRIPGILPFILI